MAKKNSQPAEQELTVDVAFTALNMKWRGICSRYARSLNYTHEEIVKLKFKIGKFDRTLHGIAEPEEIAA